MEPNRRISKKKEPHLKFKIQLNSKGQLAIEAVLLMLLFVGTFTFVMNQVREKKIIQNVADASVKKVKNLSEYGSWKETCKAVKGNASQRAANCHPNSINRALSSDPQ